MTKPDIPIIRGKRVCLRPLAEDDLPMTLAWRNEKTIRQWFFSSEVVTPERHREWFERYLAKDNDFVFIIEEVESLKTAVGQVSLYDIDWEQKRAEFGRLMIGDPMAQGKGLAKEATGLLIDYVETHLGLEEIYLDVYATNLPAIAIYSAHGFAPVSAIQDVIRMVYAGNISGADS